MQTVRAVFIDRDGVINKKMPEGDYVKGWEEFSFLPHAAEALRVLKEKGYLTVIVTNQRCVSKNIITEARLNEIHGRMIAEARKNGAEIDAVYYCPHEEQDLCSCRKPKPGMILKAIADFKKNGYALDILNSFMIGDDRKDILAGKAVGLMTIKIGEYLDIADSTEESLFSAAIGIPASTAG